jgi:hypothetical protein
MTVRPSTENAIPKRGAWLCPTCRTRCKTLNGINNHLDRKHNGEGYGIYRTYLELHAKKAA